MHPPRKGFMIFVMRQELCILRHFGSSPISQYRRMEMKKFVLASLVGGIVLFVWSMLAWMVLPYHAASLRAVSDEDMLRNALRSSVHEKGAYAIPHSPAMGSDKAAMDAYVQKVKEGPNGMLLYDPSGMDPMMPGQMVIGLVIYVFSAALAAWFLSRSTAAEGSYFSRVIYCGMLGVFISVVSHLVAWNWMGFPGDFVRDMIIDTIIGWILAGAAIAAFVKAPKRAAVSISKKEMAEV